jgi:hypothetical protein
MRVDDPLSLNKKSNLDSRDIDSTVKDVGTVSITQQQSQQDLHLQLNFSV